PLVISLFGRSALARYPFPQPSPVKPSRTEVEEEKQRPMTKIRVLHDATSSNVHKPALNSGGSTGTRHADIRDPYTREELCRPKATAEGSHKATPNSRQPTINPNGCASTPPRGAAGRAPAPSRLRPQGG